MNLSPRSLVIAGALLFSATFALITAFFWFSGSAPGERLSVDHADNAGDPPTLQSPAEDIAGLRQEPPGERGPSVDLPLWAEGLRQSVLNEAPSHRVVLERKVKGQILQHVPNELLISVRNEDISTELEAWGAAQAGRSVEQIAPQTYRLAWPEVTVEAYVRKKVWLKEALGERAVVEPNWIIRATGGPNDPRYGDEQDHFSRIFAEEGWAVRTGAPQIIVAVLDSGIDYLHPDLRNRVRPRPGEQAGTGRDDDGNGFIDDVFGWNFVDGNNMPLDIHGHGTHVAGLIGAEGNNALFGTGVAWDVTLLPVRILADDGIGTTAEEVQGLHYARVSGAHIVNASYGGPGLSEASKQAIEALRDAGIWVVAAAGNAGRNTQNFPIYPAAHDLPNVISVGAANLNGNWWGESNFGRNTVDLFAPGTSLFSTEPGEGFGARSGTSMAAALVSGALALVLAEYPDLPMEAVRSRLLDRTRFTPSLVSLSITAGTLDLGHALAPGEGRAPQVTLSHSSALILPGHSLELSASVISSRGTSLQWLFNGEPIFNQTGPTYRIFGMNESREGVYQLRVRDQFGETLASVDVGVDRRPPAIAHTAPATNIVPGRELRLFVEAVSSEATLFYQWFRDGEAIPGANQAELRIPSPGWEDAGVYFVRVSNPFGTVDSPLIPVRLDLFESLEWTSFPVRPPVVQRKEGAYYFAPGAYSADLLSWGSLDRQNSDLRFADGTYFAVNQLGEISRGSSPAQLEPWLEQDEPMPRQDHFLAVGNGRLIAYSDNRQLPLRVVDLASGNSVRVPWPSAPRTDREGTISTSLSSIVFVEGAFWAVSRSPFGLFRSEDGLAWTHSEEDIVRPLWQDAETGWVVGREIGSHGTPNTNLPLFFKRPGRAWERYVPPAGVREPHSMGIRQIPGGAIIGFWYSSAPNLIKEFRTGLVSPLPERQTTSHLNGYPEPGYVWWDHRFALRWKLIGDEVRLIRDDLATGERHFLFPGGGRRSSSISRQNLLVLGDRLFYFTSGRIYLIDERLGLRLVHETPWWLNLEASNSSGALFRRTHAPRTYYFLDAAGELYEIPEDVFPSRSFVFSRGNAFISQPHFGAIIDTSQDELWLSLDGQVWEHAADVPEGQVSVDRVAGAWVVMRVTGNPGFNPTLVEVFRRADGTTEWVPVFEKSADTAVQRFSGNGARLFFAVDHTVYFSTDGVDWQPSPMEFVNFGSPLPNRAASGWFLHFARPVGVSTSLLYGSPDGENWIPLTSNGLPEYVANGQAYRIDSFGNLEVSRLDGGPVYAPPSVSVQTAEWAPQGPSGQWTLRADVDRPEAVERLELHKDGHRLGVASPQDPVFNVGAHAPADSGAYSIHVVYRDGWISASDDIVLRVRAGRPLARQSVPFDFSSLSYNIHERYRYLSDGSHFFALLSSGSNTGPLPTLMSSADGLTWAPRALWVQRFADSKVIVLSASGERLFFDPQWSGPAPRIFAIPDDRPGLTPPRPIAAPREIPLNQGAAVFASEKAPHLLYRDGALYRLDHDDSWRFIRTLEPVVAANIPQNFSSALRVRVSGDLHLLEILRTSIPEAERGHLTFDFESFFRLPHIPGHTFDGLLSEGAELGYLSHDRMSLAVVGPGGDVRRRVRFPTEVHGITYLPGGTIIAYTSFGSVMDELDPSARIYLRHWWIASREGPVWPLESTGVEEPEFARNATQLLVSSGTADYTTYALVDFEVASLSPPAVIHGPENEVGARVRIRNSGVMSAGSSVRVTVRADLRAVSGTGSHFLGSQALDLSGLVPGGWRDLELVWPVPASVRAGEFELVVSVNPDGAVETVQPHGHALASPRFFYHEHPAVFIGADAHGRVIVDQLGTHFPYGTRLIVEAQPTEGFTFVGWEGWGKAVGPLAEFEVTGSQELRARFLPIPLAAAFPDVRGILGSDWFADDSGLLFASVTPDWSYHGKKGWFALGETTEHGSWLWFFAHGWRFRAQSVELYFDPINEVWTVPWLSESLN